MKASIEAALIRAWQKDGAFSLFMRPFAGLYAWAIERRRQRFLRHPDRVFRAGIPVIVVGNLYVGGTGKTPTVIALVRALSRHGCKPGVVSRGYGVKPGVAPRVVHGGVPDATLLGDEPALIAAETGVPVSVHPRRKAAVLALREQHPEVDVIISDDGLQHAELGRDLEIVVQDARGIGNGHLLPAGPLREPTERLRKVDFIVDNLLPGENPAQVPPGCAQRITMTLHPVKVMHLASGQTQPWRAWLFAHAGKHCAAVAAIGRPERFFGMLMHHGLTLTRTLALPDHHDYARSPFESIPADCILVTPKDAVKCRRLQDARIYSVQAEPEFSDPDWVAKLIQRLRALPNNKAPVTPPKVYTQRFDPNA